ncbi:hypothetical protein Taro_024568 [Colocasia esculenta]|uniref:Uncharacterized protein n=1 Tax=Colocasia esculenta TaxID=4460 RepID=A0A843VHV9_COLES|nr:hypothetical protein [Colocasia esculenta]
MAVHCNDEHRAAENNRYSRRWDVKAITTVRIELSRHSMIRTPANLTPSPSNSYMLFTDIARHISLIFLCDPMEQLPGRCSFGDQSFVLFIGRDMDLASIHNRVSERLDVNMLKNMLKYVLPMDTHVEQVLLDDGDAQAMFDLHKCQGTSFINLQIHAVETRCLGMHANRQSGDPQPLDRSTSYTHRASLEAIEPSHLPRSSLELYDR